MNLQSPTNRTGIVTAGERYLEMVSDITDLVVEPTPDGQAIAAERIAYARVSEPEGSLPPLAPGAECSPRTVLLLDKLGERLAFERQGVRLYQALLSKHQAHGGFERGPTREELREFLQHEHEHYLMLLEVVRQIGGDPTALTPSANIHGLVGRAAAQVLTDPRMAMYECVQTMALIERTDNDGWQQLIRLAELDERPEHAERFRLALQQEDQHLLAITRWVIASENLVMS
jgi:hypothetical protein